MKISDKNVRRIVTVIAIAFLIFEVGAIVVSFERQTLPTSTKLRVAAGGDDLIILAVGLDGPRPADHTANGTYFIGDVPRVAGGQTVRLLTDVNDTLLLRWGLLDWKSEILWDDASVLNITRFAHVDIRDSIEDNIFKVPDSTSYLKIGMYLYSSYSGTIAITIAAVE